MFGPVRTPCRIGSCCLPPHCCWLPLLLLQTFLHPCDKLLRLLRLGHISRRHFYRFKRQVTRCIYGHVFLKTLHSWTVSTIQQNVPYCLAVVIFILSDFL